MNKRNAALYAVMLALSLGLASGCATFPMSKELRSQVDKKITFKKVLADPDTYKGSTVIWGGEIVQVVNLVQGTELIVLDSPLDRGERPLDSEYSRGRFIARTDSFLDPLIYKENVKVTIGGSVGGKETRILGQGQYSYPVVDIKEIRVWRNETIYYYYPPYYGPSAYFYWDYPWGYGMRHGHRW